MSTKDCTLQDWTRHNRPWHRGISSKNRI